MSAIRVSAPPRHRLGRATLALVVVAAAATALLIHHHEAKPDIRAWTGVQMNGTTSQRLPIFAVERKGALRAVYMNWRLTCPGNPSYVIGTQFREPLARFERHGLAFTVAVTEPASDGARRGRLLASVRGRLSSDLRTAAGTASRTVLWHGGGQPAQTCKSGLVRWHAQLPAGLAPN